MNCEWCSSAVVAIAAGQDSAVDCGRITFCSPCTIRQLAGDAAARRPPSVMIKAFPCLRAARRDDEMGV